MNTYIKITVMLCLLYTCAKPTAAQVFDDWEARPNVSLKYKFNKRLSLSGTYYLYLDQNMSRYNKSVAGAELEYKLSSWMKAGIDYRYGIEPKENYHDIRYTVTFDYNPSRKWKLAYRPMLQQEFVSLNKEKLEADPVKYFWRNRLTISYKINDAIELYVFTENYLKPKNGNLLFHRQKSALGSEFDLTARSKIGTRFEVLHKKNGKVIARPNISYSYTLGYVKKKTQGKRI